MHSCTASITTATPRGLSLPDRLFARSPPSFSLNLQPFGENLDQTGEFRNTDHAAVW
jgi:hypothetical protein